VIFQWYPCSLHRGNRRGHCATELSIVQNWRGEETSLETGNLRLNASVRIGTWLHGSASWQEAVGFVTFICPLHTRGGVWGAGSIR
jgi:hypothetical protein